MFTWNEDAFPALITCMKEETDELVRANCARALGHARSPEAIRVLIDAVADRDAAVSKFAHDSLVKLTGQNLWYSQRDWNSWYQETYLAPSSQPAAQPG